jgi:hypothetical protein
MLDVKKLLFNVEPDRKVFLHLGPVGIEVCDTPEQFGEFAELLKKKLDAITSELKEYYE